MQRQRYLLTCLVCFTLIAGSATAGTIQGAPRLVSPALCAQFSQSQSISHTWILPAGASRALVSFASSIDDQFGVCAWDAEREVAGTSIILSHEQVHHPLHWRVRAKFPNGDVSNAAVGFYFVGSASPALEAPCILGPWGSYQTTNSPILHTWQGVVGAVAYEIQFANSYPHTLNRFESCDWDAIRTVNGTSATFSHESCHLPLYWRVRAVGANEFRSGWAGSYYFVSQSAGCSAPVAVDQATWGMVKRLFE